ncbi:MAG: DUF3501 family protein [Alphaproteobacteria bacterium]|nr:MAG: DUF3501 family protein [Alphaproteobacteria bacterium]
MSKHALTTADILSMDVYERERAERKRAIQPMKRLRRVEVGPCAAFYFENYDTMWLQVHEMLFIERGGNEQLADELAAYNPLIPKGNELVATLMFEIENATKRHELLAKLGGVEETVSFTVNGLSVRAVPEDDVDRTTADGKASSVQFLHFVFDKEQIAAFCQPGQSIILTISHPAYAHSAVIPEATRTELARDFDLNLLA